MFLKLLPHLLIISTLTPIQWAVSAIEPTFLVSIHENGYLCDGALISSNFVLTAANCVKDKRPEGMEVISVSNTAVKCRVAGIAIPAEYAEDNRLFNVALLKLNTPMEGASIKPIAITSQPIPTNVEATVIGQSNGQVISRSVQTIGYIRCNNMRGTQMGKTHFCALADVARCQSDIGSPLVYDSKLYGIVSIGNNCGKVSTNGPVVYTSILRVSQFISDARANLRDVVLEHSY